MGDTLSILAYGGIAALVILLVIFEIKYSNRSPQGSGYEYYTQNGDVLRIRHVFGSLFRVYVFGYCPVSTKSDRVGTYFTVRARSVSEAEQLIDGVYRRGG